MNRCHSAILWTKKEQEEKEEREREQKRGTEAKRREKGERRERQGVSAGLLWLVKKKKKKVSIAHR